MLGTGVFLLHPLLAPVHNLLQAVGSRTSRR